MNIHTNAAAQEMSAYQVVHKNSNIHALRKNSLNHGSGND